LKMKRSNLTAVWKLKKSVRLPLVVWPVVRGNDLLPDLLLLGDTISHEEIRKEAAFQNASLQKSRCGSKQIVIYQGES